MKTKTKQLAIAMASAGLLFAAACKRDMAETELPYTKPNLPPTAFNYNIVSGAGFTLGVDNDKATLGRVLFFDKHLSYNNEVACGSCHKQDHSFADETTFSLGFIGDMGSRNTPAIYNLAPTGILFWDARSRNIEDMVLMPIKHRDEMGMADIAVLEQKLNEIPYYPDLFKNAFGTKKITTERISEALSQFLLSIRADNTKYDKFKRGQGSLTKEETDGMNLFLTKLHCTQCHKDAIVSPYYQPAAFNIGLDLKYKDQGVAGITNNTWEEGMFKAPQLRNLAYTAPYMHDGRFATLEEVVDHYNSDVVNHPNLSTVLSEVKGFGGWGNNNGSQIERNKYGVPVLSLTDKDKKDLVAFLKAMSDEGMITDEKYSDPFNY
jgi:cytochrome c peroxidase